MGKERNTLTEFDYVSIHGYCMDMGGAAKSNKGRKGGGGGGVAGGWWGGVGGSFLSSNKFLENLTGEHRGAVIMCYLSG